MKTVSIVLTRYNDTLSNLLHLVCGGDYTHASISLDNGDGEMYSFNFKGFCRETLEKHRQRGVTRSVRIRMLVSDAAYARLERRIAYMQDHRAQYSYTRFGVLCCLLHVPMKRHNRYFCSQFVAEMLSLSGAVRMRKHPSLYFPNHLISELACSNQFFGLQYNPV